jgi:hypothetical protein
MPSVYPETTIPSYLAAQPSRNLIIAAHQQITHEWWRQAAPRFDLYVSVAVADEIRAGEPVVAARRLALIDGLPILELNDDVRALVHAYDQRLGLLGRARADLPHFAFAVAYEMHYLVTWNCAHVANGEVVRRLREANDELNRFTPLIVTPEEILESPGGPEL